MATVTTLELITVDDRNGTDEYRRIHDDRGSQRLPCPLSETCQ